MRIPGSFILYWRVDNRVSLQLVFCQDLLLRVRSGMVGATAYQGGRRVDILGLCYSTFSPSAGGWMALCSCGPVRL
jgi:hypothetical protein